MMVLDKEGRESPMSVRFIIWEPWMFVQNVMSIHPIVMRSVWTKVVNQPTDRLRHITIPKTLLLVWLKILIFIFSVKFSSLWMPVMWNHVTLQPHTDRMMKWQLRGWRWKKRRRGIRGGVSAYWPQCKRIIKVDWPGRSSHLVSC